MSIGLARLDQSLKFGKLDIIGGRAKFQTAIGPKEQQALMHVGDNVGKALRCRPRCQPGSGNRGLVAADREDPAARQAVVAKGVMPAVAIQQIVGRTVGARQ